jgi:hypothetical protein
MKKEGLIGWNASHRLAFSGGAGRAYAEQEHEMAHIQDTWNGTIDNSTWVTVGGTSIPNAEKYATHVENQLRAENGIPLRTHYGIDASTGTRVGLESTRIIIQGTSMSSHYTRPFVFRGISIPILFMYK